MNYLIRAEAVNLDNFVYDTNKIQPMRGGSFLLLDSVQKLVEEDPQGNQLTFSGVTLKKITTGASIGLYRFSAGNGIKPQDVADSVHKVLNDATGGHATFVVDWIEETDNFNKDLLELHARNRWRQYQQPTLVLPAISKDCKQECIFDGVRPGAVKVDLPGEGTTYLSDSVLFRKNTEDGNLRSRIYSRILGTNIKDKFTEDLQDLAFHTDMGNLNNKFAFIYLDGNKFTKIKTKLCTTAEGLTTFSEVVEKSRKKFLASLLERARASNNFTIDGKIRLETLLWGGDELEIIVPAWKGWEVLQIFFTIMKDVDFDDVPLTHAGGMVFCNNKAPIREIRKIAHELADMAKDTIKADFNDVDTIKSKVTHDRNDAFHFLVLESFDTISGTAKTFAETYYGKTIWGAMLMTAEDMNKLQEVIKIMKTDGFPRNKIFDIIRSVRRNEDVQSIVDDALAGNDRREDINASLNAFLGDKPERWFVISELWDYVNMGGEL